MNSNEGGIAMSKWIIDIIRFVTIAVASIAVCSLQDAWNATLVYADSYLISLWLVLAFAILTFILTFLPDDYSDEKVVYTHDNAYQKAFMDKVEKFEIEGEIKDEN